MLALVGNALAARSRMTIDVRAGVSLVRVQHPILVERGQVAEWLKARSRKPAYLQG